MQNFFMNLNIPGRDSGYFRITHFDFPLNDSLVKTFEATVLSINVTAVYNYVETSGNVGFNETKFVIPFELRRLASVADVAERLKQALCVKLPLNKDDPNCQYMQFLQDLSFDSATQKIVMDF